MVEMLYPSHYPLLRHEAVRDSSVDRLKCTYFSIPSHSQVIQLLTGLGFISLNPDDDVLGLLGLIVEVILDDAPRALSIALLGIEGRARVMRHHAISSAERVLDGAPDVVLGSRLDVPDITSIPWAVCVNA